MASLPTRRRYQSGVATTLVSSISDVATTFSIVDTTGWPDGAGDPFFVTIDPGTASEERILCSSRSTTTVTVASGGRGADGTTAKAHGAGSVVWPSFSATDADEANAHASASGSTVSVNVHGLDQGSDVVGTTDTQTLTNKTLTSPTVTGAAISTSTFRLTLNSQTGTTYTLVAGDRDKIVTLDNAAAITLTVPSGVFSAGDIIHVAQTGAGQVTIDDDGTSVVNAATGLKLRAQYSAATIICTAANTFLAIGDLSA